MKLAGIQYESVVDGPGLRNVIYFQGCEHRCSGCHNPGTWDKKGGVEVSVDEVFKLVTRNPMVNSITFSGGEPFLQSNGAWKLAIKLKLNHYSLWTFTGYTWEELYNTAQKYGRSVYKRSIRRLILLTDVLVEGKYEQDKKTLSLPFRGSSNQRLIDVKKTLAAGEVVEYELQSF